MHQGKDKEAKEDAADAEPPTEAAPAPVALVPKLSPAEVLRQAAAKRAAAFFKVPPITCCMNLHVYSVVISMSLALKLREGHDCAPVVFLRGVVMVALSIEEGLLLVIKLQMSSILDGCHLLFVSNLDI